MAVRLEKKTTETTETSIQQQPENEVAHVQKPGILLELAMYQNYNYRGTMFTKGTPYLFSKDEAIVLLSETDLGRPVWKRYKPLIVEQRRASAVVDATEFTADRDVVDDPIRRIEVTTNKIEIGNDEEIADILNADDSENITL
jgi:hypothetical protein